MYTCGYPSVQSDLGRGRPVALPCGRCAVLPRYASLSPARGGARAVRPRRARRRRTPGWRGGRCSAAARLPRPVVFLNDKKSVEGRRPMDNGASAWAVRRVAAGYRRSLRRRTGARRVPRGAPDWTAPTRPPSIDGKRADRTATVERPARHHNGMGTQYPAPHARHDARAADPEGNTEEHRIQRPRLPSGSRFRCPRPPSPRKVDTPSRRGPPPLDSAPVQATLLVHPASQPPMRCHRSRRGPLPARGGGQ